MANSVHLFTNNARSVLTSNISNSTTSIPVVSVSAFPSITDTATQSFTITITDGSNTEIVRVRQVNTGSNTFQLCLRGQEGTTARAFSASAVVEHRLTAADINSFATKDSIFDSNIPPYFESNIIPSYHLRQFSSRFSSGSVLPIVGPSVSGGVVTAINIVSAGSGLKNPRLIIGGSGTGAAGTLTINPTTGVLTSVTLTSGGTGYVNGQTFALVVDGPVVVMVGDQTLRETNTAEADGRLLGNTGWDYILQSFEAQNAGRRITYFERCVDGGSFNNLATSSGLSVFPSWFFNTSKQWKEYVKELRPDVVILGLGLMDNLGFDALTFHSLVNEIEGWPSKPDVIFCTPVSPSSEDATYGNSSYQDGVDIVSGYIRSYCTAYNKGFFDFNRQAHLLRDGFDPRLTNSTEALPLGSRSLPIISPVTGSGYILYLNMPMDGSFWTGGKAINLNLGQSSTTCYSSLAVVNESGYYSVYAYITNPTTSASITTSYFPSRIPIQTSGTLFFVALVRDSIVRLVCGGNVIFEAPVPRLGGNFYPTVTLSPSGTGPYSSTLFVETPIKFAPRYFNSELYGPIDDDTGIGGNGKFIPTTLGYSSIYGQVAQNSVLAAASLTMGKNDYTASYRGIGVANPKGNLHIRSRENTVPAAPSSDATNFVIEDTEVPGMSIISGPAGSPRFTMGTTNGNEGAYSKYYWPSENRVTESLNFYKIRDLFYYMARYNVPVGLKPIASSSLPNLGSSERAIAWCSNSGGTGGDLVGWNGTQWVKYTAGATVVTPGPAPAPAPAAAGRTGYQPAPIDHNFP